MHRMCTDEFHPEKKFSETLQELYMLCTVYTSGAFLFPRSCLLLLLLLLPAPFLSPAFRSLHILLITFVIMVFPSLGLKFSFWSATCELQLGKKYTSQMSRTVHMKFVLFSVCFVSVSFHFFFCDGLFVSAFVASLYQQLKVCCIFLPFSYMQRHQLEEQRTLFPKKNVFLVDCMYF